MSEDLINKQTLNNGRNFFQKMSFESENGCFKSEYNLSVTQSWIATDS